MEPSEVAALRVHTQGLAGQRFAAPEDVVAWLGAVQYFEPATWSLGTRVAGATFAAVAVKAVARGIEMAGDHLRRIDGGPVPYSAGADDRPASFTGLVVLGTQLGGGWRRTLAGTAPPFRYSRCERCHPPNRVPSELLPGPTPRSKSAPSWTCRSPIEGWFAGKVDQEVTRICCQRICAERAMARRLGLGEAVALTTGVDVG